MNKTNFLLAMTKLEKQALQKIAKQFGYNLSEYMRRKLFNDNSDLISEEPRYLSPVTDKHNNLNMSVLYKMFYLVNAILAKQGHTQQELERLEQKSLEFARTQRDHQGYKIMENKHE